MMTDTHVYFWDGFLSNFHPCTIKCPISEIIFPNSEQAYMWQKAECFCDESSKKALENPNLTPREAKNLGRKVTNFNQEKWSKVCFKRMFYVNYLKYDQNLDLAQKLLDTGSRILVEASPVDKVWGVGLAATDVRILDEKNWTGANLLGKVLMSVRDSIKK